ncbi:MAG: DUF116 domain-containing protein [Thermoanaerobacteraceae bacterium]|nr:DUF116 domain-containing protein [Thermoanaerobacteraceae bacterium]
MTQAWRLLDTGIRSAAENMALDEIILTARAEEWVPNTLRFLQFGPPCVLIGYHQAVDLEVRVDYCRQQGIEINRRITGGGALYWDEKQLGWEIFAHRSLISKLGDMEQVYSVLSQGLIEGLRDLGINANFRSRNDIEVKGRKISGMGGTEKGNAFLFQGTLLVDFDVETMFHALRIPAEKLKDKEIASARERITSVARELGYVPPVEKIKEVLAAGFSRALNIDLRPGDLCSEEKNLFKTTVKKFASPQWVYGIKKSSLHGEELRYMYKAPGGIIRVSLMVDIAGRYIKYALITGDFFVYPSRAIYDLEALLKNCPYEGNRLERVVQEFFTQHEVEIPGVTWQDICTAIRGALNRAHLVENGFSAEEANAVTVVNGSDFQATEGIPLLLPYCAKLPSCGWRKRDGCAKCGKCTVGEAYQMAEDTGMIPISINSFEHLKAVLIRYKEQGCPGFIGCCCEPFYAKHQQDFLEIGLPGLLIDIDNKTCYELGQLNEAKEGKFERQTDLKVPLLIKVLSKLVNHPLGNCSLMKMAK